MAFARKVWHLLVGIKDGLVLLFMLLFFGLLFAALSYRPAPTVFEEGALLLTLDGVIVEQPQDVDPFAALFAGGAPTREHAVGDVVRAIEGAADDDGVKAVVLDLGMFLGGGQTHLSRIGDALDKVRAADKPVLVHALAYADDGMQLAAHADEVWVDPMGGAVVAGPGGTNLFYADLIDRLKLNVHVYKAGTYKAAVEPYTRSSLSPEAEQDRRALYDALWEEYTTEIAAARPKADISLMANDPVALFESVGGDSAKAALAAGLVDKLGSREAFGDRVAEIVGVDEAEEDYPGSFAGSDYELWLDSNPVETPGKAIGVITVAGTIVDGEAGPGSAGGETIATLLNDALDDDLAALVVRVDSPGGSALASEEIRRAILRHKANDIPVVISMGNVAASGGYWIATAGDTIFAEPSTITGSIGVFAVVPTLENTLSDWGVDTDGIRTTPLSGQPDILGGFTPEMNTILQSGVESTYDRFLGLVGQSRNIDRARLENDLAGGRVWAGGVARQVGLVDRFGGLEEALAFAANAAGIEGDDWHAEYIAPEPDPFEEFLASMTSGEEEARRTDMFALAGQGRDNLLAVLSRDVAILTGQGGVQAMCLQCAPPTRGAPGTDMSFLQRVLAAIS